MTYLQNMKTYTYEARNKNAESTRSDILRLMVNASILAHILTNGFLCAYGLQINLCMTDKTRNVPVC